MHKSILITGPAGSGKSSIAMDIAKSFSRHQIALIYSRNPSSIENPHLFHECTRITELVVIDDIQDYDQLKQALEFDQTGIHIYHKGKIPKSIDPYFIIVCSESINAEKIRLQFDQSVLENFIHIDVKQ